MKKFSIFLLYSLLFIVALMAFMPKKSFYYFAEQRLHKLHVVVDKEMVVEKLFGLEIEHADLYISGVQAAKVMQTSLKPYIVLNTIALRGVRISGVAKSFLPTRIEHATFTYALWQPMEVKIAADGEFGVLRGVVKLKERKLLLHLMPTKRFKREYGSLLRRMKKQKEGGYLYEQRF
jgi:hypothetical protein